MELELNYLKGYLGTGLQCHAMGMSTADTEFDDKPIPQVFEVVGLSTVFVEIYEENRTVTEHMYYSDIFPILYPLSDYKKFEEITDEMTEYEINMLDDNPDLINRLSYDVILLMYKHHIDIHGLLNKELAINKNTL